MSQRAGLRPVGEQLVLQILDPVVESRCRVEMAVEPAAGARLAAAAHHGCRCRQRHRKDCL
jgi:hypothetical protein